MFTFGFNAFLFHLSTSFLSQLLQVEWEECEEWKAWFVAHNLEPAHQRRNTDILATTCTTRFDAQYFRQGDEGDSDDDDGELPFEAPAQGGSYKHSMHA
jgi:hypothetical protein